MINLKRLLDKSPRYEWQWFVAKRHTDDIMASLDWAGFDALKAFKNKTLHPHYKKYFNIPYWLRKNMQRVLFLKLHRTQKRLRILDLGSGFCYFPFGCAFYGHYVTALDMPGDGLFDEACKFFEVDQSHHKIEPLSTLPADLGGPFHLITAFQVCFNDHYKDTPWGLDQWEFFLDDLIEHHLEPGGTIYLEMNYHHGIQAWLPEDVIKMFKERYHAVFSGYSRIYLKAPTGI